MIDRKIQLPPKHSFFLFGPRQTGKSTLLRSIFKENETSFYDLLKSDDYLRFVESPWILREEVLQQSSKKHCVVIDEVQRIPELLNEVHHLIEAHPHKFQFALSGSSARKLKREQANLLAGRAFVYHLYPLTHRELLSEFNLAKTLRFGSLPSVYLAQDPAEARQILKAYTETYLQQEIQLEAKVRNLGAFIRFLKIAADGQGNMVNYSNIAREAGISYQTVKEHYQILEDTLLGFYLYPYRKSLRARLAKHPKFYFFDTGVQRSISGKLLSELMPKTFDYGKAFEHFIICEILRLADYGKKDYQFSFYRTEAGAEVDLIVESPAGKIYALEIKSSDSPDPSGYRGLKSFAEVCPKAELICVSLAPRPRKADSVTILPWMDIFEAIGL